MTKPITRKLAVDALLYRIFLQFGEHLRCSLSGEDMKPGDQIHFDHTHCDKLGGPHIYQNLRPVLRKPHEKKTKADLRMIKKTRPGHKDKFVVDKPPIDMMAALRAALEAEQKPKRKWPKRKMPVKHGYAKRGSVTQEYKIWLAVKRRCLNPNAPQYPYYGGKGVTICHEWRNDFTAFLAHIGPRPSPKHSVDRIDSSGNYEPGNVRWATQLEQQRNRSDNRLVPYGGQMVPLSVAAERSGLRYGLLKRRLQLGWDAADIFKPPRPKLPSSPFPKRRVAA